MELDITRPDPVVPVPVDPTGASGPTPGQARGARFRTSSPGLFTPIDIDVGRAEQRIVEAVAGGVDGCAATGWSGLCWERARRFGGTSADGSPVPVLLAVGDSGNLANREGVRFCYDWLFEDDVVHLDGLPITRSERSVCAAVLRTRSLEEAVRIISMAMADDLVDRAEMRAYADRIKGRPHTIRLRQAIEMADENLWSPREVTLLMRWRTVRPVAPLRCHAPIFDLGGRHLLTPDLLDPEAGIVGQYDGMVHEQTRVRRRDLAAEELCRELGLQVVSMNSTDLRDLRSFDHRLANACRRAASQPSRGGWTLAQPPWWVDTSTVARRRALSDHDRRIWLPWQAA